MAVSPRNKRVVVLFNQEEWDRAAAAASEQGMPLSTFVRVSTIAALKDYEPAAQPAKKANDIVDPWAVKGVHALAYYLRSGESARSLSEKWSMAEIKAVRTIMNSARMTNELRAKGAMV